jgi:hypothetical protein
MSASMVTLVSEDGDEDSEREGEGEDDGVEEKAGLENNAVGANGKGKGVESAERTVEAEKEKENTSPAAVARPEMDRFYTALESPK